MSSVEVTEVGHSRASASIVAAGIIAILGGTLGALFNIAALVLFSVSSFPLAANYPAFMRPVLYVLSIFFLLCAVFVLIAGIQVIHLKNWARIALLITSGCLLFFGITGIVVIFVTLLAQVSPDPLVSKATLDSVLAVTYGIPTAISIWWLILFTRRAVVAQFKLSASAETVSFANANFRVSSPSCPLGIRIVGWYLASFVLVLPLLPFISGRFPAFYFGHVFRGAAAVLSLFLHFTILFISGFGLLVLKKWSYPLTIAAQFVICANAISATFSSAYAEAVRATVAKMDLPQFPPTTHQILDYSRYFNLLSLAVPIAIVITLLVLRTPFFAAADSEVRSAASEPIL